MYVPSHFAADQAAINELLSYPGAANLVTSTERGLLATLLPFVYDPEAGDHGALLGHSAATTTSGCCRRWANPW